MTEFSGSKGFLNIPAGIAHDKELLKHPKAILLMGEINSMLNVTNYFFMSNNSLGKRLNCTPRTAQKYIHLLEKRRFITRTPVYKDETKTAMKGRLISRGPAFYEALSEGWNGDEQAPRPGGRGGNVLADVGGYVPADVGGTSQRTPKENSIREQDNRAEESIEDEDNKKKKREIKPETKEAANKIIPYLNQKTGGTIRLNDKNTLGKIQARLNQHFTVEDFYKVIDYKTSKWLHDPKMVEFLTPATLFAKSHFGDYLNQANIERKAAKDNGTDESFEEMTKKTIEAAEKSKTYDDNLPF